MKNQEYIQKLLKLLELLVDSNYLSSPYHSEDSLKISLQTMIKASKEISYEKASPENDNFNNTTISFIETFLEANLKEKNFTGPFKKENPAFLDFLENPSRLP